MYVAILLLMTEESSVTVKGPVWVAVLGVLIPAAVTIMGWFILRWNEDRQNRQRGIESELTHRERQIKEFYGPLFNPFSFNVSRKWSSFSVNLGRKRAMFLSRGVYVLEPLQLTETEVFHIFQDEPGEN